MFSVQLPMAGVNPFTWDALRCPLCDGKNFVSKCFSKVLCGECYSTFTVNYMFSEADGCTIMCDTSTAIGQVFKCVECERNGVGNRRTLRRSEGRHCRLHPTHEDMVPLDRHAAWVPEDPRYKMAVLRLAVGEFLGSWRWTGDGMITNTSKPNRSQWLVWRQRVIESKMDGKPQPSKVSTTP